VNRHYRFLKAHALRYFALVILILLFFIRVGYSIELVVIEFFYFEPCSVCPGANKYYEIYLHNSQLMNKIQDEYASKVLVKWINFSSPEGQEKRKQYNISHSDWNSIVINHEVVIKGYANETFIREFINYYLGVTSPLPPSNPPSYSRSTPSGLMAVLMLAFWFGFFETFSPCLIVTLSFIASYTLGKTTQFKESFYRVMTFGIGFVSAAVLLGLAFGLAPLSIPTLYIFLTWIVCIFALFFGLNLLGLLNVSFQMKPLIRKIAKKYAAIYAGIFLLGFIFYFLDPCIGPIFFSTVPLLLPASFPIILFVFGLGAIIPFVSVGIFAGSLSKLARNMYRHRLKIRAVNGSILIGYALYFIVVYLLPKLIKF